jgi:HSP20 family protein
MDPFSKRLFKELEQMQSQTGKMLRNLSLSRMMPMETGLCQPPVDIYEAESEVYVYVDVAGVDGQSLKVTVDEHHLKISGSRSLPAHNSIACIHQLEIELGQFQRTVALPSAIEVDCVESRYENGILVVTLPKRRRPGKVNITISAGE